MAEFTKEAEEALAAKDAAQAAAAKDVADTHEQQVTDFGKRLAATAQARQGRQRDGLRPDEALEIEGLLREGDLSWKKIKARFPEVSEATLEGWKGELVERSKRPAGGVPVSLRRPE